MNALKYHWCETSLLAISSGFEACGVQIFHLSVQGTSSVSCQESVEKSMVLFHIKKFSYHVTLLLKENFSMWVTSGLFCGSNGSAGVTQVSTLLQWHTHAHTHTHTQHTHTHTSTQTLHDTQIYRLQGTNLLS